MIKFSQNLRNKAILVGEIKMRRIYSSLFAIVLACTVITGVNVPIQKNVQASVKQQNKKAMKAYKKKLSAKKIAWGSDVYLDNSESKFAKMDINGDGVKELIVENDAASHMSGYIRIFTYKNGKVKSLGHFTDVTIYKNKKLIKDLYSNHGTSTIKYYQFSKGGKIKRVTSKKKLRKLKKGAKVTKYKVCMNTKKNRDKYLR